MKKIRLTRQAASVFLITVFSFCFIQCNDIKPKEKESTLTRLDRGNFVLKFENADEMSNIIRAELDKDGLFTNLIKQLNDNLKLPHDVPITFTNIGEPNAFYVYDSKSIYFGYEFVNFFKLLFSREYQNNNDVWDATSNATYFFLLHEIGHALVDIYKIPSAANPEDLADNFAIYMLTGDGASTDVLLDGTSYFQIMTKYSSQLKLEELPVLDEHGLDPQRYFNLVCKIYASNPERYNNLITEGYLDESKIGLALQMYQSNKDAWDRDLKEWVK